VVAGREPASVPEVAPRNEIVVSAGGGAVGIGLLAAALAARNQSRHGHLLWRVLAGPNVSADDFQRLLRDAGPGAVVERSREDFVALLGRALVSVSQAGYNTALDVIRSGARPVLVPYAEHGETEQRTRAGRLRDLGLAVIVEEADVTPAALARAVDLAASREQWPRWDFDCDGAARSAALIAGLIEGATTDSSGASRAGRAA
jgi:predicted glycosyltransferase